MISMQKLRGVSGGSSLATRNRLLASLALIICLLAMPLGAWGATAEWDGSVDTSL